MAKLQLYDLLHQPACKNSTQEWRVAPIRSFIQGLVPDLSTLPHIDMIAINYPDNVIYRNVAGEIKRYVPEQ